MSASTEPDRFDAAPDLLQWIRENYIDETGPLFTPDHAHLQEAEIGCLWTSCSNRKKGKQIVGQAQIPGGGGDKWQTGRTEQQLREWFGLVPDFVLTFDALHCDMADDGNFAALVDHELFHCAQDVDSFGSPRFDKITGLPKYRIKGHDIEEFVGVVKRFGVEAAGEAAIDFVLAAAIKPTITTTSLVQACGTCLRIAA